MSNENSLNEIIVALDNCMPPHITLSAVESGTMDLTEMIDEFDGDVRNVLELEEREESSIEKTKTTLSDLIGMVEADETITRGDLLKHLLQVVSERVDDLRYYL